jgi:hypothetical protein
VNGSCDYNSSSKVGLSNNLKQTTRLEKDDKNRAFQSLRTAENDLREPTVHRCQKMEITRSKIICLIGDKASLKRLRPGNKLIFIIIS